MTVGWFLFQNSNFMFPCDPGKETLLTTEILRPFKFAELPPQQDTLHTTPLSSLLLISKTSLGTRSLNVLHLRGPAYRARHYWWVGFRWKRQIILKGSENRFIWLCLVIARIVQLACWSPNPPCCMEVVQICSAFWWIGTDWEMFFSMVGTFETASGAFEPVYKFGIFDFKKFQSSRNTYCIQTATLCDMEIATRSAGNYHTKRRICKGSCLGLQWFLLLSWWFPPSTSSRSYVF